MLSRSVNILFYFCLVIQNTGVQIVVKGTPREGHPLKEGLRLSDEFSHKNSYSKPREGHPLKEGLRLYTYTRLYVCRTPREGHPLKEGLRLSALILFH